MELFDLYGEVAFVTGRAAASASRSPSALRRPARTSPVSGIPQGGLDETAGRIAALGRRSLVVEGTVTSEGRPRSRRRAHREGARALSIAVNNAGIAGAEPAETLSQEYGRSSTT